MKKLILLAISALFVITLQSEAKGTKEAKVYSNADFIRLRNGVNIYGEGGENPSFKTIPEEFDGRKITLRSIRSSDPLEFKVKEAGVVTLIAESKGADQLSKQAWVKVGKIIINQRTGGLRELPILQKELEVGEYSIPSEGLFGIRVVKK
jgi:hypothetical protein